MRCIFGKLALEKIKLEVIRNYRHQTLSKNQTVINNMTIFGHMRNVKLTLNFDTVYFHKIVFEL